MLTLDSPWLILIVVLLGMALSGYGAWSGVRLLQQTITERYEAAASNSEDYSPSAQGEQSANYPAANEEENGDAEYRPRQDATYGRYGSERANQTFIALTTAVSALSAFMTMVFTGALVVGTFLLWMTADRQFVSQSAQFEGQLRVAQKSADAAAKQVNMMAIAKRPSFELAFPRIVEPISPSQIRDIRSAPMPEKVWVSLAIRNITMEPAKIVTGRYGYTVAEQLPPKADYPHQTSFRPQTTVSPRGQIYPVPRAEITFTQEQRAMLDAREARLWFWGYVVVEDSLRGKLKYRFAMSWQFENATESGESHTEPEEGFGWWAEYGNEEYYGEEYTPPPIE